jgi:Rrf2 family cysteine metabolism transcriptional repressor
MKFSAKGEYGIRAVLDMALYSQNGPAQVKEIARRQAIPERFLEQVMASLRKAGLVESVRGAQGGYLLAYPPTQISLADIIQAVEGPIAPMKCVSEKAQNSCNRADLCVVRDVWREVQTSIVNALNSITVEEMCKKKRKREAEASSMYYI